jgi:hypothetical protein
MDVAMKVLSVPGTRPALSEALSQQEPTLQALIDWCCQFEAKKRPKMRNVAQAFGRSIAQSKPASENVA